MSEQEKQTKLLEEILTWIKVPNVANVKTILTSTLNEPQKKLVYHLSDGKSKPEIAKISKISDRTISNYWNSWRKLGLTKSQTFSGGPRQIKIFNLEDFDIAVQTPENSAVKGAKND